MRHSGLTHRGVGHTPGGPISTSRATRYAALTIGLALIVVLAACGSSAPKAKGTATAHPTAAVSPTATPLPDGWGLVASPAVGQEGRLLAISARSASDAWAVGQYEGVDSLQRTLVEHWNGSQWAYVNSPSPGAQDNVLQGVSADSASDVWAVGAQSAAGVTQPLVERWNGSAWSVATLPSVGSLGGELTGVAAIAPGDVWAVGYSNTSGGQSAPNTQQPLAMHWNGSQWQSVTVPSPSTGSFEPLNAVTAITSNDVWAVGSDSGANTSLIEHFNGRVWQVVTAPTAVNGGALTGIAAAGSGDVWAVGAGPGTVRQGGGGCGVAGGPVIEHFDGTRWSAMLTAQVGILYGVTAVAANDVWAVGTTYASGPQGTLLLHWNGKQWLSVSGPAPTSQQGSYQLSAVAARSSADVYAAGTAYDYGASASGPQSQALVERWDGTSWRVVQVPQPGLADDTLAAIAALPGSHGDVWAVGAYDDCPYCDAQQALITHFAD